MRASRLMFATLRETPGDAEVISHQLMLRAGMIRKLATGLYTWLPLGVRVLNKVTAIIREEMNKSAMEVLMPVTQPIELWEESGRAQAYGPELLRFRDRHDRPPAGRDPRSRRRTPPHQAPCHWHGRHLGRPDHGVDDRDRSRHRLRPVRRHPPPATPRRRPRPR